MKTCSFDGCNRDIKAKGLCAGHYQQAKAGKPLLPLRAFARRGFFQNYTCKLAYCEREATTKGLCNGHYQQQKAGLPLSPLQPVQQECGVDLCSNRHEAQGYCKLHYDKWRTYGDPFARGKRDPSIVEEREGQLVIVLDGKRAEGQVARITNGDLTTVNPHRWWLNYGGYVETKIEGRKTLLHRLILGLAPDDPRQGDHINGDVLDNRRENLRVVTYEQQMQNKKPWGKSGHRNVYRDEKKQFWRVIVTLNGKRHYGGRHKELDDAIKAAEELRNSLLTHHVDARC